MITGMDELRIEELSIPKSIDPASGDSANAADFIDMAALRNEVAAHTLGTKDLAYSPAELLPTCLDPYWPQRILLAREGGAIIGCGIYETSIDGSSALEYGAVAWLSVEVRPASRRRGVGGALYGRLAGLAETDGRPILQAEVLHAAAPGARIDAPTGFGSVPRDTPETRFLLGHGYRLEQVERVSRLPLPLPPGGLAAHRAAARAAAGGDYRAVVWDGPTPERWLADLAHLHERMSTDAPSAGLEIAAEHWDAQRVRTTEELERTGPRTLLHAAIEHTPSGRLVAFNELSVPAEPYRAVEQRDTLVLREHRGHRLGMLVKTANLLQLEATHPGHPSVTTFNAEENRHMLAVNEALGFLGLGYSGGWKKAG
jgi:GNAT superfamily N-acetyltransferase